MDISDSTGADFSHGDKLGHEGENLAMDSKNNADESDAVESDAEDNVEYLSGYQLYMVVFAMSLVGFLYTLDVTIIVTAIPVITTHFHTIQDIGWYGSAYLITVCACCPLVGKIYQYYNSKITFFTFVAIFEIGSLVCGVAPSSTALIIGRAVAGIGGSGLFNGALTIVAAASPKENRAHNLAFVFAFSILGIVAGPIFGGLLTERASWRWCFYINLPAGAFTLAVITFVRIPDTKEKTQERPTIKESISRLDPVGFVLFAPTCIMVLLALQWGGSTYAWNSATIIGLFIGFGASLGTFFFWENRRGDTAMVPLSMLRQRVIYSSCLTMMAQYGSLNIFAYYLPVWFQTILGVTPIKSGAYFMATAIPVIITTMLSGFLLSKIGNPAIFSVIGNILAAIGGGLMSTFTPTSRAGLWVGYQIIAGVGRGTTLQQPLNAVQQTLHPSRIAVGTSIVVFCQFFGGALFLALAETDFSNSLGSALKEFAPGVNETLIFNVGATAARDAVSREQLPGVLRAYNQAIMNTFYLGAAASALAVLASCGMGLKSMKSKKPTGPAEA